MLEEQIKHVEEVSQKLSEDKLMEVLLVLENNKFLDKNLKKFYKEKTKQELIEIIVSKLNEKFDLYGYSFLTLLPGFLKAEELKDDELIAIIENVFENFDLTNAVTEKEKNRQQVLQLLSNKEYQQTVLDFINDELLNIDLEEELMENYLHALFIQVMYELLYIETQPLTYDSFVKYLNKEG